MDIALQVKNTINKHHLFTTNNTILVACSGGADSVVLTVILHQLGYNVALAHVNFSLRAEQSDADAQFVTTLANSLNVPLHILKVDTKAYAAKHKLSTQVAAREIRYNFFVAQINASTKLPYDFIATAHNANDVIETALMHFCKGTGLKGLASIPIKNGNIVRPLMHCTRLQIEEFAANNKLSFVTDSSNNENYYTRNFVRNEVLPLLQTKFPTLINNITQTVQHSNDALLLYKEIIAQKIAKIVVPKNNEVHIPILKLQKEKAFATILYEIAKPFGFESTQLPELLKLINADSSSNVLSATYSMVKNRNWLLIIPKLTTIAQNVYIKNIDQTIEFENGTLTLQQIGKMEIIKDANIAQINANKLEFPLLLRKWKEGDYFYPLGMPKKKKVARFLIDLKLSKPEKENVWVVESNQKIIWVVGYRIDDRFKVNSTIESFCLFAFKGLKIV